jgi:DNA-binding response OmpR family regulator
MEYRTILVVDDEPDVLETVAEVLENWRVRTAATFNQAMELLETEEYDMTILDIMGVKGLDLLAAAARKNIPAIMLTAPAMNPDYILKAMELGAVSYVSKEDLVNLDSLLKELCSILDSGQSPWPHTMKRLEPFLDQTSPADWREKYPKLLM